VNERDALRRLAGTLSPAGDDAAVVDDTVITTDMLHEQTDFPPGTSRYTAGWRAVGASLSDVAAMGATADAAVAVYADEAFDPDALDAFLAGAVDVCDAVDAAYVGGDLDTHAEFTTATTAIGTAPPGGVVSRAGASPGDAVCVTGTWGRSAAALRFFERETQRAQERANELFRFEPRVAAGRALAAEATAMMDSSDGLARSLHQIAAASEVGIALESAAIPIAPAVDAVTAGDKRLELAMYFGEDFELVCVVPEAVVSAARAACPVEFTRVGTVTEASAGVTVDGEPLSDRGYTHG